MRLDRLMLARGIVQSRSRAQALIMAGKILVNGKMADKAGQDISDEALIKIKGPDHPYVSRGGIKIEAAIGQFKIDCYKKTALDIGASTGGFTDCLLQHGAKRVYALDVGYGQLDWRLRQDDRVINIERVNARYMESDTIPEPVDIVTIDCSFISLKLILSRVVTILSNDFRIICLIKPQFEVGKGEVEKGGIVRDEKKHERVLKEITAFASSLGLYVRGLMPSPIKGPKGNREFFICLIKSKEKPGEEIDIEHAIQDALSIKQFRIISRIEACRQENRVIRPGVSWLER